MISPWKYPKTIETGRNIMSLGFFLNRPTSLITLVKPNMKMNWAQNARLRASASQSSVAHQQDRRSRGSTRNARDVKVARCRA